MSTPRTTVIAVVQLVIGALVTLAAIGAWVFAKLNNLDTGELMAFVVPIVGALFLVGQVAKGAEAAQQAAQQTNGMLDARVKAAVAAALADRDAARTRQAVGDIAEAQELAAPRVADPTTGGPYTARM